MCTLNFWLSGTNHCNTRAVTFLALWVFLRIHIHNLMSRYMDVVHSLYAVIIYIGTKPVFLEHLGTYIHLFIHIKTRKSCC